MNWITKDLGSICVVFNLQPHDQENQCCLSEYIRKRGLCVSANVSARSECKVGLGARVELVLPTGKCLAAAASHASLVPASRISLQLSFLCPVAPLLVSSMPTSLAF